MGKNAVHPAFELIRTQAIEALHLSVEEYVHRQTGARHLHFASDIDENVFLVALKTVPGDSTGVAHILEHTALCGSERYPVRDPFFMMVRRSLNTFMNAFTSSDWTAYPFASRNRKDFGNLLQVYLDAVFFARLDELDFRQEGHRIEFEESGNPDSDLVYKGVVYNEMKGAMSSASSQLWYTLTRYLYPNTTYHYNSGGDPEHIVDLSYEQLKSFYRRHYHPSNAVFMTFGNIPAQEHQQNFEALALSKFTVGDLGIAVPDEKRYSAPLRVMEHYPVGATEPLAEKTHLVMAWLLGQSFDLESNLEAHLLTNVLFENSAAPLQRALESSELGSAPSPVCGLEDSNREMAFSCGLEGSEPEHEAAFEQMVLDVLTKVAEEGVAKERLEAVLHQLELSQREISGDSYPYGLQIMLATLSPTIHGGDPVALIDLDPVLVKLRARIEDPGYFKSLVQRLLLDNPHRVTLVMKPDAHFERVRNERVHAKLQQIKQRLSDEQKQALIDQAEQLKQRQLQKDDESILPKVEISDVPLEMQFPHPVAAANTACNITTYDQGTNGLVYQQIIIDLPALSDELRALMPIYTNVVTELGAGAASYLDMQNRQSEVSGGIHAFTAIKSHLDNLQAVHGVIIFSGKALARNHQALTSLMADIVDNARFDELERIRELVAQMRAKREQSVVNNGHGLAMSIASSGMSPVAQLSYQNSGIEGIKRLKLLDQALNEPEKMQALAGNLAKLHALIKASARRFLAVAEADTLPQMTQVINTQHQSFAAKPEQIFALPPIRQTVQEAWLTSTQVNFCAKAFPTVGVAHPDAPVLTVLGSFLRNGFLHRVIREQGGAYGGGAAQDSTSASFRFYSYRDPRLAETLEDFDQSIVWLKTEAHEPQALEEAILGVVSSIDKPRSPAGAAKSDYQSELFGRTKTQRAEFRQRVLKVTLDDLKRVADTYLRPELASIGVVTSAGQRGVLEKLGVTIKEL